MLICRVWRVGRVAVHPSPLEVYVELWNCTAASTLIMLVIRDYNMFYRAGRPICRKVLKIMFWEVPPTDLLILLLPTALAGPRNSHG